MHEAIEALDAEMQIIDAATRQALAAIGEGAVVTPALAAKLRQYANSLILAANAARLLADCEYQTTTLAN